MALEEINLDNEETFPIEFVNNKNNTAYEIHYKGKIWSYENIEEYVSDNGHQVSVVCTALAPDLYKQALPQVDALQEKLKQRGKK